MGDPPADGQIEERLDRKPCKSINYNRSAGQETACFILAKKESRRVAFRFAQVIFSKCCKC